jgi:pilus assembly protein FimV
LSGADVSKSASGEKALQEKLIALQEEATAKEGALKEAQSRTADLEKQIEDMKKLMALKSDAMAKMQNDAAGQANSSVASTEPEAPAEPIATPVEGETSSATEASDAQTAQDAPPVAETPAIPKPAIVPPPPMQIEQPSFIDGLAENVDINTLGFAGGGLALLGAGWLYLRNKRKKNLASFEEGIMTSGGLKANTVFGNTAGGTVDTGDTSFLTDFSQSTSGGMIDSHDVDPIAEAEVYMAYGRDAQAEEILKDAIVKEPKRYELHLKLLEIYQASGNTSAFETISGELYTSLGASDPVWAKVAQLGVKMDPDNPLYQVEASIQEAEDIELQSGATSNEDAKDDFFASFDAESEEDKLSESFDAKRLAGTTELDSNNTTISNVAEQSPFDIDLGALDFDMDSDSSGSVVSAETIDTSEPPLSSESLDMLNLDDAELLTKEAEASDVIELSGLSESDLSMDVADFATSADDSEPKSLDVPTIDFPNFTAASETDAERITPSAEDLVALTPDEDLDFNINLEAAAPVDEPSDLGLSMAQVPNFDLTDINLELNDVTGETSQVGESSNEPEEVETKLDLVMAYLDMEDKIGARELLEEVLKEGGENQRKRASELMEKIG